jgi:hypothetical protein
MKRKQFRQYQLKKKNPHIQFYFEYPDGKINSNVTTWRDNHSNIDYVNDNRMRDMATELKFNFKKDFEEYLECTFSVLDYVKLLRSKGIILA